MASKAPKAKAESVEEVASEQVDQALLPDDDSGYSASLVYVGPIDVLEIGRPDGTRGRVRSGGTFKTTDDHAAKLLEQAGNWEER